MLAKRGELSRTPDDGDGRPARPAAKTYRHAAEWDEVMLKGKKKRAEFSVLQLHGEWNNCR
jgi:hypothetical protein